MPKKAAPKGGSPWQRAFRDYRLLHVAGLLYILGVVVESVYCGVPLMQFLRVGYALLIVFVKIVLLLLGFGGWVFWRQLPLIKGKHRIRRAFTATSDIANRFMNGEVFAYGCTGALVLAANCFFFIQKSLIRRVSPYVLDPQLAAIDKTLHLGHYPHEWIIPASDAVGLSHFYDIGYYVWFLMMYLLLGFNLFIDRDLKRRLKALWVFFLSWVVLGSVMATIFASVGPLFYHDFYPKLPDPYSGLLEHFLAQGPDGFPIAFFSRDKLIGWTRSPDYVSANALSAMPSLHVSICWLAVLYARTINRAWCAAALLFCALIYFGTIYFGFHYAIDSYVSIAVVSLMWWGAGRLLDRRHPVNETLTRI